MVAMSAEAEPSTGLRQHTGGEEGKRAPAGPTGEKTEGNTMGRNKTVRRAQVKGGNGKTIGNSKGRPPSGEQAPRGSNR
jgi:hypothetical protein